MNVLRYAPLPLRPARFAALQAALGCHDLVVTEAHPASPDVIMAAIASSHPAVVVLDATPGVDKQALAYELTTNGSSTLVVVPSFESHRDNHGLPIATFTGYAILLGGASK